MTNKTTESYGENANRAQYSAQEIHSQSGNSEHCSRQVSMFRAATRPWCKPNAQNQVSGQRLRSKNSCRAGFDELVDDNSSIHF